MDGVFFPPDLRDILILNWKPRRKRIEDQLKIERSASEFKFKGNRKQFEVNVELKSPLSRIKPSTDDSSQLYSLVQEAQQIIRKRQKLIKITERRLAGGSRI